MNEERNYMQGLVLNEETRCSLTDLCGLCGVPVGFIHEMMEEGIIAPAEGNSSQDWLFTLVEIKRVQTTIRLQRDLRVNMPGCALALDLLDQLDELRCLLYKS